MRASADWKWSTASADVSGRQLELFIEQPAGHMINLMMLLHEECPVRRNGALVQPQLTAVRSRSGESG